MHHDGFAQDSRRAGFTSESVARAKRTSRSAVMREALEEQLKASAQNSTPSLYERSADLCDKGVSGLGDLASYPKHLKGFGS